MTSLKQHIHCFLQKGFSLIEMAIVLVVVALLLGGLLVPLTMQIEQQKIRETQKAMEEIKEALVGFAVANRYLPCPAVSATNGAEGPRVGNQCNPRAGFVPWSALGVTKLDGWGRIFRYSVTPAYTDNTTFISLTSIGDAKIQTRNSTGTLIYLAGQAAACSVAGQCMPAVVFSHGKSSWGTDDSGNLVADSSATNTDEDANNLASSNFISRTITENTAVTGGEFDDLVTWISPNILFNRMVAAGKLP